MGPHLRALCLTISGVLALALTGCNLSVVSSATPETGMAIQGRVMGGQSPIQNAQIYLFQVNNTVYGGKGIAASSGNASSSLLQSAMNTYLDQSGTATNGFYYAESDPNGNWSISHDYACTPNDPVYLYSQGGTVASGTNSAATLMAVLGNCPVSGSFSTSLFITLNEVSTVAAAYAMAGFATDPLHVSTSGSFEGQIGIENAFSNAANLEDLSGGDALAVTPGAPTTSTVPQAEIYTLANILAACVNTNGSVSGPTNPTPCYTLFANALSGGTTGTQPTDTATAAINIAHNPGANVAALFALSTATPPFGGGLATAPNDFTVAIGFSGGGISTPSAIVIDSAGDAWITDDGSTAGVTEMSPLGVPLNGSPFTVGGLASPTGIAIDLNGNAWIANDTTGNTITGLSSTGTALSGSPFTGGNLNEPDAVAVDSSDHVWVGNAGQLQNGTLSEFNNNGSVATGASSGFGPTFGNINAAVAIDLSGNVWTINSYLEGPEKYVFSSGSYVSATNYSPINDPTGLAVDNSNHIWFSTHGSNVVVLNNNGTVLATYTGGGVQYSQGICMDGAGDAWVVNTTFSGNDPGLLSEFSNGGTALTSSAGYKFATMLSPTAIAVDGSGDVWVTNRGNSTVSEFIGAAVPVATPLAYGLQLGQLGTRP